METEDTITTATEAPKTKTPSKAPAARKTAKPATKTASKGVAKIKRAAKTEAKNAAARPATGGEQARNSTKKAIVLELLHRKQGATTAEIAKATDWQNHSIRGFISGNVTKKMGLAVESAKSESGERTYKIVQ